MTQYQNLIIFSTKVIKDQKSKKFALTLYGDALEYALPDFKSTFSEISIIVNFDDSNNFTFKLLLDNVIKNVENTHINSKYAGCVGNNIAYIMYTMFKKYGVDINKIELE